MAAKRLTRKEIVQQDSIRKTLTETSHWAVEHSRTLVIGVVSVLAILLIGLGWQKYSQSQDDEIQAAFSDALAIYHAPLATPEGEAPPEDQNLLKPKYEFATTTERFEKALAAFNQISEDFSGSRIVDLSRFYAGLSLVELGRNDEAQKQFESLSADSSYPDVRNQALNSLAQLAAGANDPAKAAVYLQQIIDNPSENYPRQIVLARIGEALEASGDLQGALDRYRQITSEFVGTNAATAAQEQISRLEARLGPAAETAIPPAESTVKAEE